MSALFHHAMRQEWIERTPREHVRQDTKRARVPDVLELAEHQLLLSKLRVSQLLAPREDDIGFKNPGIRVTESIWHQVVGVCKTEASAKPVPTNSSLQRNSP